MSKRIEFMIDTDGNVSVVSVEGYGSDCLEATKTIEDRLGGADEGTRELTDEYYSGTSNDSYIEL